VKLIPTLGGKMSNMEGKCWRAGAIASALLILAACGGGGGGGSSGPGASKVFAMDEVNSAVGSSANPNPAPGTGSVDRIISGPNTQLPPGISMTNPDCQDCLRGLALDAQRDHLYVSVSNDVFSNSGLTAKVLVFHNAGTAAGNIAPSRTISLAADQKYIQLDTQRDVLYVSTRGGDILAVQGASAANSSGVTPPTFRTLNLGMAGIVGIALDPTTDVLYIAGSGSIGTIRAVSTKQTGAVALDDQWSVSSPVSLSIDSTRDRLFVSVFDSQGSILVYDGASTRTTAAPGTISRTITLPSGFSAYTAIFLEPSADRLYAVGQNKIFVASSVGSANGPQSATLIQLSTMNSGLTAIVARP
jgi:hypothetical protein